MLWKDMNRLIFFPIMLNISIWGADEKQNSSIWLGGLCEHQTSLPRKQKLHSKNDLEQSIIQITKLTYRDINSIVWCILYSKLRLQQGTKSSKSIIVKRWLKSPFTVPHSFSGTSSSSAAATSSHSCFQLVPGGSPRQHSPLWLHLFLARNGSSHNFTVPGY